MWAPLYQVFFLVFILFGYSIIEFLLQYHFHPKTTNKDNFLITRDYLLAFACGILELLIESIWFPIKNSPHNPLFIIGLIMIFVGLFVRFSAILHAGKSFDHRIQYVKDPEHKLITDGIYKYIRHPGYFGFLVFAVGTQVYYSNPICIIGFYIVLFKFFKNRIEDEEAALCRMFPGEYQQYRAKTKTWIPGIY